jgi:copper homeostasis protein (lipoprotein)
VCCFRMKNNKSVWIFIIPFILLACTSKQTVSEKEEETTEETSTHNAKNSLDWQGTYKAILPCADCEGINTILEINKDQTYTLISTYLGKTPIVSDTITSVFVWKKDGKTIELKNLKNKPNLFMLGENYLLQLDVNGNKIQGNLAENYRLQKQ